MIAVPPGHLVPDGHVTVRAVSPWMIFIAYEPPAMALMNVNVMSLSAFVKSKVCMLPVEKSIVWFELEVGVKEEGSEATI